MNNTAASVPALAGSSHSESTQSFWTWPRVTLAALFGLIAVTFGVLLGLYVSWNTSGKIAPGLIVQGEDLSGLSRDEAKARLEKRFGRLFVSLETPERPYKLAVKQLGGQVLIDQSVNDAYWFARNKNFASNAWTYWTSQKNEQRRALPLKWEKEMLRRTMWTVASDYQRAPRDARLEVGSAGIQIIPDETGRKMNVGATCATLQKGYFAGKEKITATTEQIAPRLVASDLAGRDVQFAKYTTYFNAGLRGRTTNIRLAADAINGKVLMPGEKFSFNQSTGERTGDKGYRIAHIFLRKPGATESEVVDGRGGGVCQVSSTLYNAVRKTNNKTEGRLSIIERNNHSLPVDYVPSGLDATVAWPYKDFRFRNTLAHPVYIRAEVSGSRLTIGVWGRVPDNVSSITVDTEKVESVTADSDKQASTPAADPST